MHYTKTVFIRSTNQTAQFKALRVGQWVTGLSLNSKSGLYRGQFLGMDNDNMPIINLRVDNAKRTVDWKEQFRSNRSLRTFAKIKA
jgi:putative SOS response-associated peptidase YedK